jgi:hypothetical protein
MTRSMANCGTWRDLWKVHANWNYLILNTRKVLRSNMSRDNADDVRYKARRCSGTHLPMSSVNLLNDTTGVTFALVLPQRMDSFTKWR